MFTDYNYIIEQKYTTYCKKWQEEHKDKICIKPLITFEEYYNIQIQILKCNAEIERIKNNNAKF